MNAIDEHIGKEAGFDARQETLKIAREKGPKLDKVLLRLRQALNAQETKVIKLKGAVTKNDLPKGFDLIINTGVLIEDKDGQQFGTGESLVKYDVVAHGHRLKAVDLALQLHDAMPNQKYELLGAGGKDLVWTTEIIDPKQKYTNDRHK